jgi:hypothetical protein
MNTTGLLACYPRRSCALALQSTHDALEHYRRRFQSVFSGCWSRQTWAKVYLGEKLLEMRLCRQACLDASALDWALSCRWLQLQVAG